MAQSKSKRTHKQRVAKYKENMKKNQELLKRKTIEDYIKLQQKLMAAQQEHTSTQEVNGPEIDIDDLNTLDVDNSEFSEILSDVDLDVDDETVNVVEEESK